MCLEATQTQEARPGSSNLRQDKATANLLTLKIKYIIWSVLCDISRTQIQNKDYETWDLAALMKLSRKSTLKSIDSGAVKL